MAASSPPLAQVSRDSVTKHRHLPGAGKTGGVSLANESIAVWKHLHIEGYTDPQDHARLSVPTVTSLGSLGRPAGRTCLHLIAVGSPGGALWLAELLAVMRQI